MEMRSIAAAASIVGLLAACAAPTAPRLGGPPADVKSVELQCGELPLRFAVAGDAAWISVGTRSLQLRQVPAASGAKYAAADDPTTSFWNKGEGGTLEWRGERLPECRPGRLPFRARGNEPSWRLDAVNGQMRLASLVYGAEFEVAVPLPEVQPQQRVYRTTYDGKPVQVTVTDRICRDLMSGMPFPRTVTVLIGTRQLNGCGGESVELLQGPQWQIEQIDGRPVGAGMAPGVAPSLAFGTDGSVTGSTGCNRYRGGFTLTGESLSLSLVATTRMACAAPAMALEQQLLTALGSVRGFNIDADGSLQLLDLKGAVRAQARP
jgi:heat shock protein HslJ/membrane-bound inhibitor of C-type lysozyme